MFKKILFLTFMMYSILHGEKLIKSSGGTMSAPLYYSLAYYYEQKENVRIKYDSIGSYGAINQVKTHFVDFISTEKPLLPTILEKYNLIQFPSSLGSVAIAYNLPGSNNKNIKIDNKLLSSIFLGKVVYWDDERIKTLNPKTIFSHKKIIPIYRSDKSGTTYNFTNFLTKVSPQWEKWFGTTNLIKLPQGIGAVGNNGVAVSIKNTPFSIGYLENVYRLREKIPALTIQSLSGQWVSPIPKHFKAAIDSLEFKSDNHFYNLLTLSQNKDSYPIVVQAFTIIPCENLSKNKSLYPFFKWMIESADDIIFKLGYTPLPMNKKSIILDYINNSNCTFEQL